jgi:CBS domain-containing protein/sporulation protein YlmC with PRC-barrel domain
MAIPEAFIANAKSSGNAADNHEFRMLFFSTLSKLPVCAGTITRELGPFTDLVFRQGEPYPEAIGIHIDHGWGNPSEFIPWEKVIKIDDDAVFVQPPEGKRYPPFIDQPGWILLNDHLMGKTILDMDGRRTEVVNDVQLLESKGRLLLVHVDISFNGFLRKWGLGRLIRLKDQFISWKYVQPLSVEDAIKTDAVALSITHKQIRELPPEDLADALEELSGEEQQAVFSALDEETAAETLIEAEPRAQRQLVANLSQERAKMILGEMSVAQLAKLFSALPHEDSSELMDLIPKDQVERVKLLLTEREVSAKTVMSTEFVALPKGKTAGEALQHIRQLKIDQVSISYIYVVVADDNHVLIGVVDLRDLVLAGDTQTLADIMSSPVVSANDNDLQELLAELFDKYNYRMIPVVDAHDILLGVVHYHDIMENQIARPQPND